MDRKVSQARRLPCSSSSGGGYFFGVLTLSATSMCKAFSTMRGMFSANHWRSMGRSRSAVESSIGAEAGPEPGSGLVRVVLELAGEHGPEARRCWARSGETGRTRRWRRSGSPAPPWQPAPQRWPAQGRAVRWPIPVNEAPVTETGPTLRQQKREQPWRWLRTVTRRSAPAQRLPVRTPCCGTVCP